MLQHATCCKIFQLVALCSCVLQCIEEVHGRRRPERETHTCTRTHTISLSLTHTYTYTHTHTLTLTHTHTHSHTNTHTHTHTHTHAHIHTHIHTHTHTHTHTHLEEEDQCNNKTRHKLKENPIRGYCTHTHTHIPGRRGLQGGEDTIIVALCQKKNIKKRHFITLHHPVVQ